MLLPNHSYSPFGAVDSSATTVSTVDGVAAVLVAFFLYLASVTAVYRRASPAMCTSLVRLMSVQADAYVVLAATGLLLGAICIRRSEESGGRLEQLVWLLACVSLW